jgi:glycerol-3-phosphate acyltransferase PlsY
MSLLISFFLFLLCYLLGSIPSGYIIGKIAKGIDIRQHGSKNVGATNALRVLGTKLGILTLFFDFLKGLLAIQIIKWIIPEFNNFQLLLGGVFVIFGHIFTVFLSFKGGKGVATSAGVFLGLIPFAFVIALLVFLITVILSKYVSLGSILGVITLFTVQIIENLQSGFQSIEFLLFVFVISVFIIYKHKDNIKRLCEGNENKLHFKK